MVVGSYVDEAVVKVFARYEEQLKSANAVDFEDLIGKVVKVLEDNPGGAGDALRRRFTYVLVDEFQDTNHAQYRFLRALRATTRTSASWETTTSRFTAGAGPTCATSAASSKTSRTRSS